MHLQGNALFDQILLSTLYIMWPIQLQDLRLLRPAVMEEMHLQENSLFGLDLGFTVTQNVASVPLHHVAYSPAWFEVATSNRYGGDAFTRKYIIRPLTLTLGLGSMSHKM